MQQLCECDSLHCTATIEHPLEVVLWLRGAHPNALIVLPDHVLSSEQVIGWDSAGEFAVVIGDIPHGIAGAVRRAERFAETGDINVLLEGLS